MLSFSVCINYITVNSGMDYKYFVEIKSTVKKNTTVKMTEALLI